MKATQVVALAALMGLAGAAQAVTVSVGDSNTSWNGFMNVFELPSNGGGFVFPSGWGVGDLRANFNDPAGTLTLSPNTIGDPNPFWYIGGGAPGNPGNKIMEANLYVESTGAGLNGQNVNFVGNVISNSFTSAHVARIFIRDFAPDFSSVVETIVPLVPGPFSISLNTINDPARHVQYGFQVRGVNVWVTDTAPFGNAVIGTIPAPAALSVLGLGGLVIGRRRR